MIPKWLANVIVALVALVWAGNFVATVFVPDYRPDPVLNFVFLVIVGSALALKQDGTGSVMTRIIGAVRVGIGPMPDPPTPPSATPAVPPAASPSDTETGKEDQP